MIGLTRLDQPASHLIIAGSDSMDLYLALRRRGLPSRQPPPRPAAFRKEQHAGRTDRRAEFACGDRGGARSKCRHSSAPAPAVADPDRLARKRCRPEDPRQAGSRWAFGSKPACRCQAGPRAFRRTGTASARWKTQREIAMTSLATPATLACGLHPRSSHAVRRRRRAIDLEAFWQLCERQIEAGVTALVVCETTGEASTLSPDEQSQHHPRRRRGRARPRPHHRRRGIELDQPGDRADAARGGSGRRRGALGRALLQQADAGRHRGAFPRDRRLDRAADHPARRSCAGPSASSPTTRWSRLAQSRQLHRPARRYGRRGAPARGCSARLPAGFRLLSGDDATALAFIASGGDGCISMVANVAPNLCRTIYACCRHENWQSARALHGRLAPLASALAKESPAALKAALHALGLMHAGVRLPLVELDGAAARDIARLVVAIGERDFAAAS